MLSRPAGTDSGQTLASELAYIDPVFLRILQNGCGAIILAQKTGSFASLRIPDGPEKLSLPHKNLPVSELITFTSPPQRKSTVYPDPADYLSELPPIVETLKIAEMVVPPSIVVKNLGRAILMDSEMKSIVMVHSPAHRGKGDRHPLWLATVWSILERVREAKALWRAAVDPLHERLGKSTSSEAAAENIKASLVALKMLPWDGEVKGFRAGDHEDHLLELLAAEVGISDGSSSCIQTTYFVLALAQAYENPTEYRNSRQFQWLRRLGMTFATKDRVRLGTIANEGKNH
ncbi:hypothetical protein R3P38DRAFT_3531849 [Favolaschia claudopus]|uniref:Uncharacterized protein n=1 Tax=Favolaschia claudopus TaxID=2862362 RepID=A0AAW0BI63_9AGAR